MNIEKLKERFKLTSSYKQEIYSKIYQQIVNDFSISSDTPNQPKLIFAAGQPGAGKTLLINAIKREMPAEKFTVIDIDMFRYYHPDIDKIKKFKTIGSLLTNDFVFSVEDDLLAREISLRHNILYVGTLRDTEFVENKIIKPARDRGYKVHIYAMSVDLLESFVSAQLRYEEQLKKESSIIHFISSEFHDASCDGFERSLKKFCDHKLLKQIKLYERGKTKKDLPVLIHSEENPNKKI